MAETHIQIGDITPRIQYTGDGAQTLFTYPFPIFQAADMEVYLDDVKQATGFTVNGAGQSAGGDVTFDTAPANGVVVTLRRRLAIQRTSDFQESGEFRSKVINDELDYLTAALQQVSDDGDRTLQLGATDPTASLTLPDKAARTSMYLGFDANGDPIATDASGPVGPTGPGGSDGKYTSVGDGLTEVTASQIAVDLAATPGLEFSVGQLQAKVDGATISRTAGGLAIPAGGVGTTELSLSTVAQAEAEAGTATTERLWTAERVKQAIAALGGGQVELVSHQTPSLAANVAFTGLAATGIYMLFYSFDFDTNTIYLRMQVGTGGTPTYQTTNYGGYGMGNTFSADGALVPKGAQRHAEASMRLGEYTNTNRTGNQVGDALNGKIFFCYPGDTDKYFAMTHEEWGQGTTDFGTRQGFHSSGSGSWENALTAVTAFKLFPDTGNLSGKCTLFRFKEV